MQQISAKNRRRRERLHHDQCGLCYYCRDPVGVLPEQKGSPVLEHYIPHSAGGTRVVLACKSCDKMKGMIHGPEFEAMMREKKEIAQSALHVHILLAGACKKRNAELQAKHWPRVAGQTTTTQRRERIAAAVGVSITEYPPQSDSVAGNSGGDRHIELWMGAHYMNFTSDEPGEACVPPVPGV